MHGLRWTPGIGDPTLIGWFTVFAYFLAAWLCLRAFMVEKAGPPRSYWSTIRALFRVFLKNWRNPPLPAKRSAIWLALAVILTLLGINKQLDFQTLLTDIGRAAASIGGWYGQRRLAQALFVLGIGALGALSLVMLFRMARGPLQDFRRPFLGLTVVVLFVLLRAATFHHIGRLIGSATLGSLFNFVLELTGIVIIGASAFFRIRRR